MTQLLPTWGFDPDTIEIGQEAEAAIDFRTWVGDDEWLSLVTYGTWWALPIGTTTGGAVIAIRLEPGRSPSTCPVVELAKHEARTICSSPAHFVSRRLFPGVALNEGVWDRRRDMDEGTWKQLLLLHVALGGTDDLSAVRAILNDGSIRAMATQALADGGPFLSALPSLIAKVDSDPSSHLYWPWLGSLIATKRAPWPLPDFGPWQPAAIAAAFAAHEASENATAPSEDWLQIAWAVMNQPPAIDSFQSDEPRLTVWPSGRSQTELELRAAQLLVRVHTPIADPLWSAVQAIATDAEYAGAEHLKASLSMAQSAPPRAYVALQAASYWQACHGEPDDGNYLNMGFNLASADGMAETASALGYCAEHVREAARNQ